MRKILIALIRIYQYAISPYIPSSCRYTPTCSAYAIDAIRDFGTVHGSWLAIKRVSRCHPWHEAGIDPVPEKNQKQNIIINNNKADTKESQLH